MGARSLIFRSPDFTPEQVQAIVTSPRKRPRRLRIYIREPEYFKLHSAQVSPFVPERLFTAPHDCGFSHWEPGSRAQPLWTLVSRWLDERFGTVCRFFSMSFNHGGYTTMPVAKSDFHGPYVDRSLSFRPALGDQKWDGTVALTLSMGFRHWDNEGTSDWTVESAKAQLMEEIVNSRLLSYCGALIAPHQDPRIPGMEVQRGTVEARYTTPSLHDGKPLNNDYAAYLVTVVLEPNAILEILRDELQYQASFAAVTRLSTNVLPRDIPDFAATVNDLFTDWEASGLMHVPQEDLDRYIWSDRPAYDGEAWLPLAWWYTPVGKSPIAETAYQLTLHREGDRRWVQASTAGIDEDLQRAEIQRVTGISEWQRIWPPIGELLRNLKPVIDLSMD